MMSESLILALLGGALGVVVAKWSIPVLESIGSGQIPRFASVTVDLRVLAFTALATSCLYGWFSTPLYVV